MAKTDRDAALDVIVGKSRDKLDKRYRGRTLLEQLSESHPLIMIDVIHRLEDRLSDAMADGKVLSQDDILLIRLEAETMALRAILGGQLATSASLLTTDSRGTGKAHPALSPFSRLTGQLLQIINMRKKHETVDDEGNAVDSVIEIRKLISGIGMGQENE